MQQNTIETLTGEFRAPKNTFQEAPGSIHNDAIASKLGFKGGTVPGSVHMDQFVPMLLDLYGPKWFETGDISLYFTQATVHMEQVRAEVTPGEQHATLKMYNEAGALICVGTASDHAPDSESEVARRMRDLPDAKADALRILADVKVGTESTTPLSIAKDALKASLEIITEPLAIYESGDVLPPSHGVRIAHQTRPDAHRGAKSAVGLFGALEVRHFKGPLRAGVDYLGKTKILKLTESPKTESVWYDVTVHDPASEEDVASVIFMIRYMKASSPLWTETAGT